jgi:hypothetical protein
MIVIGTSWFIYGSRLLHTTDDELQPSVHGLSTSVSVDATHAKSRLVASAEVVVGRTRAGDNISRVVAHSISDCMQGKHAKPLLRPI